MQMFNHAGSEFAREHGIAGDWAENPDAYGYALAYAVEKLIELYPGPWGSGRCSRRCSREDSIWAG